MAQFVGYSIDDHWPHGFRAPVPVSTGSTRDEALSSAITRVLSLGIADGGVAVRELEEPLEEGEWSTLTNLLDGWFKARGTS